MRGCLFLFLFRNDWADASEKFTNHLYFNTVSGWITETLGDFPEKGRKIDFNGQIEFEVLKSEDNIIREVKAVLTDPLVKDSALPL